MVQGLPVIAVTKYGLPVSTSTRGLPVTVSTNGFGLAVTPVLSGGMPVFDLSGTLFGPAVIPANTAPPVITGTTAVDSTLLTSLGTWSGSAANYSFQWKRGGVNIAGATTNVYTLVSADLGAMITVTVTATNTAGSASATAAAVGPVTAAVSGTAPVNTVAPVITGSATVGALLTTTSGTWTGSPTPTYTYQWQRGTPDVPPANTAVPTITGALTVGQTLTAVDGTWTGTAPITYTRQWKRDGVNISGANASTYVLVSGDIGAMIHVTVTATNAAASVQANASAVGPVTSVPSTKFDSAVYHAAGIVFSNGDLTMVAPGTGGLLGALTLAGHATGKYYCEYHLDVVVTAHNWGISNRTATPANPMGVYDNDSCGMYSDGQVYIGGVNAPPSSGTITPSYPAQGDYVDMALDLDNGRIWFRLNNGLWNNSGTANPATNVGGLVISTISGFGTTAYYAKWSGQGNGDKVTANFGPTYTRTKPSGFGDW